MSKLKKIFKSDFFKVSLWSGVATIVRMGVNLAISKILAVLVGPSGFALVGQLQNGLAIFRTLSTGAISNGVTKYVAEFNDEKAKQQRYIIAALRITIFCSFTIMIVTLLFSKAISVYLFHTVDYRSIIIFFALGIVFFALNGIFLAIINGFKRYKVFISASIVGAIFLLILSLVLVFYLNLYGALLAFSIGQSLVFFVTAYWIRKDIIQWLKNLVSEKIDKQLYKQLFSFSLMALTSALVVPFSEILIRNYITDNISLNAAGIWEGMNKISTTYLGVITLSLSTYYLPKISGIKVKTELLKEISKVMKLVAPATIMLGVLIYLLRDFIISILFTAEFTEMRELFAVKMLGDSFKIMSWVLSFVMLAKAMTVEFILTEIIFSIAMVLLSFFLMAKYQLIGSIYAYAINYFLYLVILYFIIIFSNLKVVKS